MSVTEQHQHQQSPEAGLPQRAVLVSMLQPEQLWAVGEHVNMLLCQVLPEQFNEVVRHKFIGMYVSGVMDGCDGATVGDRCDGATVGDVLSAVEDRAQALRLVEQGVLELQAGHDRGDDITVNPSWLPECLAAVVDGQQRYAESVAQLEKQQQQQQQQQQLLIAAAGAGKAAAGFLLEAGQQEHLVVVVQVGPKHGRMQAKVGWSIAALGRLGR